MTKKDAIAEQRAKVVKDDVNDGVLADDSEEEDVADAKEREERCILAASAAVSMRGGPEAAAVLGPGTFAGPMRYLPPGKVIHTWWEYRALQSHNGKEVSSYNTFRKVFNLLKKCHVMKFRTRGQHAVCCICTAFKKELRQGRMTPTARAQTLERYSKHLVSQWMDRQVYDHMQDMSMTCSHALSEGQRWASTMLSRSVLCISVDGMDQAKFRVPRKLTVTHTFEKLLRPAMHVHGIWAHGAGYALAVSDSDMKKDTCTNVEVVARMIDSLYRRWGTLPLGLHLHQDNTSRECKKQKMRKFAISLVAKGVFRWTTLGFLITGHTHIGLDATYGQITLKLSHEEFDDDMECVELLSRFVTEVGIDKQSRDHAIAYKLDEVARWDEWWDQLGCTFSNLTGPDAPHYFRVCLRKDLGEVDAVPHDRRQELRCPSENIGDPPQAEDIMLVVKSRLHDLDVKQVVQVLPAALRTRVFRLPQPRGLCTRRAVPREVREKCARTATNLHIAREISTTSLAYLTGWSRSTRARQPRPADYKFLNHHWLPEPRVASNQHVHQRGDVQMQRVRLSIVGVSGQPLPRDPESEDDAPLVEIHGG